MHTETYKNKRYGSHNDFGFNLFNNHGCIFFTTRLVINMVIGLFFVFVVIFEERKRLGKRIHCTPIRCVLSQSIRDFDGSFAAAKEEGKNGVGNGSGTCALLWGLKWLRRACL